MNFSGLGIGRRLALTTLLSLLALMLLGVGLSVHLISDILWQENLRQEVVAFTSINNGLRFETSLGNADISFLAAMPDVSGILQILQQRSQNYTAAYYALPGVPEKTIQDHRKILTALGKGKADLVEAMLKRDMTRTGKIPAGLVQKREQSQ
jgi:hypothetical protein